MSVWLILGLAAMTYLSRAAGLAFMPRPSKRATELLERVVAPLFAGFAAISLVTPAREPASAETLFAVGAALVAARTRSLLAILAAGTLGYALGELIW